MTATHRVLVLAASPSYAVIAARWVRGDAWVVIGPPNRDSSGNGRFDAVIISGDLSDSSWISTCFDAADQALGGRGTASLVLADAESAAGAVEPQVHDLPDDVAARWRMTSMVVEEPWTGVGFVRASAADNPEHWRESFRRAQALSFRHRHPAVTPRLESEVVAGRGTDSRWRRLAVRLARRVPGVARRRRRLADRAVTTLESRLLALRVPLGSSSMPRNLSVGVIVADANRAGLADWLRSVCRQRHQFWTCVVVDDASHHDIATTIEPLRLADPRIRLARHGGRRGLSASRNTGLRLLDSDLIVFADTARAMPPTALADAVAGFAPFLGNAEVAGLRIGPDVVDENGDAEDTDSLAVSSVLLRRSVLDAFGWFDEGIDDSDAWDALLRRILSLGLRFESFETARPNADRAEGVDGSEEAAHIAGPGLDASALAADIGFDVVRTGSLDSLDPIARDNRLIPSVASAATRPDIADGARAGIRRGLADGGATGTRSLLVEDKVWRLGEVIADEIVGSGEPAPADARTAEPANRPLEVDVLFVAESVADVGPLAELVAAGPNLRIGALDVEFVDGDAGANEAWRHAGVPVVPYHHVVAARALPRAVIGCAPVGPTVRDLLSAAQAAGSACQLIQVPGRPGTMSCNAGSQFDALVVARDDAVRFVSSLRPDSSEPVRQPPSRWRGTDFSAVMYAEDGPIDEASSERLTALRDHHRGGTAVIIGNGPSLNETDLTLLADVPTFGVNGIFLAADRFPRPITYYVVEDTSVFNENLDAIRAFPTDWKLFPAMYRPAFADDEVDERTIFFRMNAGFYGRKTGTVCHPRFSLDATQRLFCGQSVTILNLQLAHWMGFRRVVLIGMDFSYTIPEDVDRRGALIISQSDDPNHFHPDYFGAGKSWKDPLLDRVLVNYHLADEVYRATGREIINATVGGHLDVFPRLSLKDALDGAPAVGSSG